MALATNGGGSGRRPPASNGGGDVVPAESSWQVHRLWGFMPVTFWVYVYKVHRCPSSISHNWEFCPYAHPGERVRRRDPRRFRYLGVACPDYRDEHTAACARGRRCRYAHGHLELWLHPKRFRTRMCDAGSECPRSICFHAHSPAQLRREDDQVPPFPFVSRVPPNIIDIHQRHHVLRLRVVVDVDEGGASSATSSSTPVAASLASSSSVELSDGSSIYVEISISSVQEDSDSDDGLPDLGSLADMLERLVTE
ncbi:hypothetical protein PR202_ga28862 [Eleusine coracana subsp. coracana]|uniref:C3H1-type domain-containing protein n=1 Tax=Eleusine coracana subsp. coracana TaxID=191504 RepID=A0AAV5DJM3_ELECO|nr:hypothetical protein PR202_ga28862 [Eleusine coracana subsp. coracana]